jgi:hypothetical protein
LVEIFFKSPDFYPLVLQQQLTSLDFVSYCGGSLGLFLGFSALSAVEFVYYFTLRLLCLKRSTRKIIDSDEGEQTTTKKKNYLVEFVENSSIHGCNQIVMRNRHWVERVLWVIMVCLAVTFCGSTTKDFFTKYQTAPVMLKYEDSIDSLEEIPFPAITINNELVLKTFNNIMMNFFEFSNPPYEYLMEQFGERFDVTL